MSRSWLGLRIPRIKKPRLRTGSPPSGATSVLVAVEVCTRLVPYLLFASLIVTGATACSPPPREAPDGDVDAGDTAIDAEFHDADDAHDAHEEVDPRPSEHESFVPDDLRPTSASRLIVIGDSIAYGRRASSEFRTFYGLLIRNDDQAYPEEQGNDLEFFFGNELSLFSAAMDGGNTTFLGSLLSQLGSSLDLPASGHSIVVVSTGSGDLANAIGTGLDPIGEVLDRAIDNIRAMVDWFDDTRFPDGVSIYLTMGAEPSDGVGQADVCFDGVDFAALFPALVVWRERLVELGAELGFAVIDGRRHFNGHGYYHDVETNPYYDPADPTLWFTECLYFNDRGHSEMRRLFYEAIDRSYVAD